MTHAGRLWNEGEEEVKGGRAESDVKQLKEVSELLGVSLAHRRERSPGSC